MECRRNQSVDRVIYFDAPSVSLYTTTSDRELPSKHDYTVRAENVKIFEVARDPSSINNAHFACMLHSDMRKNCFWKVTYARYATELLAGCIQMFLSIAV